MLIFACFGACRSGCCGITNVKPKLSLYFLRRGADRGDPADQYELGCRYAQGSGVAKDGSLAFSCFFVYGNGSNYVYYIFRDRFQRCCIMETGVNSEDKACCSCFCNCCINMSIRCVCRSVCRFSSNAQHKNASVLL